MLSTCVLALALTTGAEKPRLAVLDLQLSGVEKESASALYDSLVQEVSRRGYFEVVSSKDIQTLLGLERQKQVMGCGDAAQSCMAELAGALGSRFVLSGSLSRLGDALQLSLQMLDTQKSQPVGRAIRIAKDARALVATLPWAVAEATATPAPPQPSTALPWTLVGLGAASLAVGAFAGIDAFSRDQALAGEFKNQDAATGVYKSLATYKSESAYIGQEKTVCVVAAAAGAALLAGGILTFPADPAAGGGGGFAVVPTQSGAALVGVWP